MDKIKHEKILAAKEAVKFVEDGMVLGLGTGSTAGFAIAEIGAMVKAGLRMTAVPTSAETEEQARSLGIPIVSIDEVDSIDLTIDGTDEFDADLNLIKGGGGALLKEKMVARMTRRQVIIADSTKMVKTLGAFNVPVEVIPYAVGYAERLIEAIGGRAHIRLREGANFLTDERNYIIDADFGLIRDAYKVSDNLNDIEGVVCNGLFLDLTDIVIVGIGNSIEVFTREDQQG